jgi:5'-3' exonuclease
VSGIDGIGPKKGAKLVNQYDSIEHLLQDINNIPEKSIRTK